MATNRRCPIQEGEVVGRRHAFLVLLAFGIAPGAAAQTGGASIDQISVARPELELLLDVNGERRSTATQQLASESRESSSTTQVTPEQTSAPSADQLSKGPRTALPPQPLSRPAEGRNSTVERVSGTDRCDPADPKRPRRQCARVIENRSAEFARPDPNALSPEQRLLLEQEVREGALNARQGAHRLATTGEADESLVAMGVAATVINQTKETPEKASPEDDISKAADIVGAIIGQPLTPQQPQ